MRLRILYVLAVLVFCVQAWAGECELFRDPLPNSITANWICVDKQQKAFNVVRNGGDVKEAARLAIWSFQAAWAYFNAGYKPIKHKKSTEISRDQLFESKRYFIESAGYCHIALKVNIGTSDAKKCLKAVNEQMEYVKRCLGEIPWPDKNHKKSKGGKK